MKLEMRELRSDVRADLRSDRFDLGVFACGYETRSSFAFQHFSLAERTQRSLVLAFPTERGPFPRNAGAEAVLRGCSRWIESDDVKDDVDLFSELERASAAAADRELRIVVDYSSMTRSWYGQILAWCSQVDRDYAIEVVFVYSQANYDGEFGPLLIDDVVAVPFFDGRLVGVRPTTAFFCIGFDGVSTLAVLDRIEADEVICLVAVDPSWPHFADELWQKNKTVLDQASKVIKVPTLDVVEIFTVLAESCGEEHRRGRAVVLVPMGPKTVTLASLLAGVRLPATSVLHVRGKREKPADARPTGLFSVSRVRFDAVRPIS